MAGVRHPCIFSGTCALYVCNRELFCASGEVPECCFTGATPLKVVRVEKFPGNFSSGAVSAADSLTAIAHFPTTPQSRLHQCRNSLGISPLIPPSMKLHRCKKIREILHWCKTKVQIYTNKNHRCQTQAGPGPKPGHGAGPGPQPGGPKPGPGPSQAKAHLKI